MFNHNFVDQDEIKVAFAAAPGVLTLHVRAADLGSRQRPVATSPCKSAPPNRRIQVALVRCAAKRD